MKPGDLLRTRCDRPPPIVEWDDETDFEGHTVPATLPPGVPVVFLRRGFDGWAGGLCVLVGGRVGWVWDGALEPL